VAVQVAAHPFAATRRIGSARTIGNRGKTHGSPCVIAGLVPAISMRRAQCADCRDGRHKPGHDQVGTATSFVLLPRLPITGGELGEINCKSFSAIGRRTVARRPAATKQSLLRFRNARERQSPVGAFAWTIRRHASLYARLTVFQSLLESGSPQSFS